ncbi:hypothetical protein Hdeb2414_s0009g00314581 [Helianthus debilis subsp. tardiflorus]
MAYRSHVERFWQNAKFVADPATIHSFAKVGNEDKKVIITEDLIQRVLDFLDEAGDHTGYPKRMVKGCFYMMGYTGYVNETNFSKANISRPYKFFKHSVIHIHAVGHRKGGYDVAVDYVMCMIVTLTLYLPYNFSKLNFKQMKTNLVQKRF